MYTWGDNDLCVLGHVSDQTSKTVPTLVDGALAGKKMIDVACGDCHTAALSSDGSVFTWGCLEESMSEQSNDPSTPHTTPSPISPHTATPPAMRGLQASPIQVQGKLFSRRAVAISCGAYHTGVLTDQAHVFMWGANDEGQLGLGHKEHCACPQLLMSLKDKRAKRISCGAYHSGALLFSGALYTWGSGGDGELGHGNTSNQLLPIEVRGLASIEMQLLPTGTNSVMAVQVRTPLQFVEISCGGYHTAALAHNGIAYTWGYGGDGQLGQGHDMTILSPAQVVGLTGIKAIACGAYHTLASTFDGRLLSWGCGSSGMLGAGSASLQGSLAPLEVGGLLSRRLVTSGEAEEASKQLHISNAVSQVESTADLRIDELGGRRGGAGAVGGGGDGAARGGDPGRDAGKGGGGGGGGGGGVVGAVVDGDGGGENAASVYVNGASSHSCDQDGARGGGAVESGGGAVGRGGASEGGTRVGMTSRTKTRLETVISQRDEVNLSLSLSLSAWLAGWLPACLPPSLPLYVHTHTHYVHNMYTHTHYASLP